MILLGDNRMTMVPALVGTVLSAALRRLTDAQVCAANATRLERISLRHVALPVSTVDPDYPANIIVEANIVSIFYNIWTNKVGSPPPR